MCWKPASWNWEWHAQNATASGEKFTGHFEAVARLFHRAWQKENFQESGGLSEGSICLGAVSIFVKISEWLLCTRNRYFLKLFSNLKHLDGKMCRDVLGVVWAEQDACVCGNGVLGLLSLLREVRNYYMILKVLSLKLKKRFSPARPCRSWEVLSTYCSHDLRALTSMASLQSLDGRSTEGLCPASASKQTSVTFHTQGCQSHMQSLQGSAHSRGQDMLEWCLVSSSRKFVR